MRLPVVSREILETIQHEYGVYGNKYLLDIGTELKFTNKELYGSMYHLAKYVVDNNLSGEEAASFLMKAVCFTAKAVSNQLEVDELEQSCCYTSERKNGEE